MRFTKSYQKVVPTSQAAELEYDSFTFILPNDVVLLDGFHGILSSRHQPYYGWLFIAIDKKLYQIRACDLNKHEGEEYDAVFARRKQTRNIEVR